MQSPSSQSVHNRRQEKQLHRNHPLLRALLEVAGVMVLILGVIATSPASGVQEREANHDFEVDLVDFQPHDSTDQLDSTDQEEMIEESEDQNGASVEPPMQETETETDPFFYENCDAARAAGAAPVHEGEHGFGPHLDADNDGIGCEHWSAPAPGGSAPDENGEEFFYENCTAARAAGAAPVHEGEHGFGPHLDADNDGIGCELGR